MGSVLRQYSVAVLGEFAAIGKSALTLQYTQGRFVENSESGVEGKNVYKLC